MKAFLKYKSAAKEPNDNQRGATIIIVALMLVVLLGFAALAVDIGYVMASRNEAQNVADAAALAGAGELGQQRWESEYDEITSTIEIKSIAHEIGLKHQVAGEYIDLPLNDIEIGYWDPNGDPRFTRSEASPDVDAVRVTVRRDNVGTFFARVLNIDFFNVSADATAALSGLAKVAEGELEMPVGISAYWFDYDWTGGYCDQDIKFSPTGDIEGCAGWNTFDESPSNANTLKNILEGLESGDYEAPEVVSSDSSLEFTGGDVASAFPYMKDLYDTKKDPVTGEWETTVVVYDSIDCSNPGGSMEIVGFATVIITDIQEAPDKLIQAEVICGVVENARGGGGEYGTLGRIPGLVE